MSRCSIIAIFFAVVVTVLLICLYVRREIDRATVQAQRDHEF
jgi:predicted secreted protein